MFNESALREYLEPLLPTASGPLVVEPLTGGQSNPTFRLRWGGATYVLRKQPHGELLPSAHAVDREYRVMTALADPACRCRARTAIATTAASSERRSS